MSDARSGFAAAFTPEQMALIRRAYAEAVDIIAGEEPQEELRHKLAEHMIFLARNGEADEERLCSLSVIAIIGRTPERSGLVASSGVVGREAGNDEI